LQISFLTTLASFIYVIFQSALRGVGEVKFPLVLVSITVVFNFFLDPLFMYGWKFIPPMGVGGVALATLLTETLAALVAIIVLWRGSFGVRIRLRDLWPRQTWMKKLFTLGLPSSLEMSARSFGMFLLTFMVSTFGTIPVAAYGIGVRMLSFIIIPAMGFSIATTALVGNNLGARQHARAENIVKTAMKIAFITLTILGVLLFIFAKPLAGFLVPGELEVITLAAHFLRLIALTFGFIGVQMVVIGAVKAAGQTTMSMLMAMFHSFALFVLSYMLSTIAGMKETGIWVAYPIANFLALLLALYVYRKRDWLKKELV
jgi:putative MATE family efflux protein